MRTFDVIIIPAALALCTFAAYAQNISSIPFSIRSAGNEVNTKYDDYSPSMLMGPDTLYFNSYREKDSEGNADVFIAERQGDTWGVVRNAGKSYNTPRNDGSVSMADDGYTIVFASDRKDGFGDTDLYFARWVDGRLEDVLNLGKTVNSGSWESQPTITGDAMVIYFASDRPGGRGGTDIWMIKQDGWGNWGTPINLGETINTPGEERAPCITKDGGTLYFSSTGLGGYGKLDVYLSKKEGEIWGFPMNLGPNINSSEDEVYFFAPASAKEFYFASGRSGGSGQLDVYMGTPNVFGGGLFTLVVNVLDGNTDEPLASYVDVINSATNERVWTFATNTLNKDYSFLLPAGNNYRVEARFADASDAGVVENTQPNEERLVQLRFGSKPIAEFDLGKYNIPFFVTGYYRPNTGKNLDDLMTRIAGPLARAGYIERFGRGSKKYNQYRAYSETVEDLFKSVYRAVVDDVLPRYDRDYTASDALEFTITGYADPQPMAGQYIENDTIRFFDVNGREHLVRNGDAIGNLELSGLRAWHSARHLKEMLLKASEEGKPEFARLLAEGRIIFKMVGGDVSEDYKDYAVQRRIKIVLARKGQEGRNF